MGKISERFQQEKYEVFFGHDMPIGGYKYIEDYSEEVKRDFFIALFKLFVSCEKGDFDVDNTIDDVDVSFDDEFGYYGEDDYDEFIESLEGKDVRLTKKEKATLHKYLANLLDEVVDFERDAYDPDYEDSDIEDAIEDKSFVIVVATRSL